METMKRFGQGVAALPPNLRGALWMLGSALLFTVMATLVKILGARLDSFEVAFFRSLTGILFILPLILHPGRQGVSTRRPWLHLLRGALGSCGMMFGFYAFVHLPLATASAISFARTLFLVPLAVLFVGETVGYRRLAATIVGFIGVLIILRPSATTDLAALVAVLSAIVIAGAVTCVKILSREDGPMTLLFTSSFIGVIATAIPAAMNWVMPTFQEFVGLGIMGAFGIAAQTCFIRAYSIGEVSALAPIDYTRLLLATAVGFFLFGSVPDFWVFFGAAVIVASTLYITMREARKGGRAARSAKPGVTADDVTDKAESREKSEESGKIGQ